MSGATPHSGSRRALSRQARELSDWLDVWDPIGVYPQPRSERDASEFDAESGAAPPPGEYDCMVWPLLGLLRRDAATVEVVQWLHHELDDHFGLSEQGDVDQVAEELQRWWRSREQVAGVLEPELAAALLARRLLPPEELPMLAAHWLAAGLDGPALRELAGLSRRDPHVRELWAATLGELGVVPDAGGERAAVVWAARQVAGGQMSARDLVSGFWPDDDSPSELDGIVYALDEAVEMVGQQEVADNRSHWWRRLLRGRRPPLYRHDPAEALMWAVQALADGDLAEARRVLKRG